MKKGEVKRQAFLDVSEELFYKNGYTKTSIQDILDRLGCSKGSFYHHFESKMQVLADICQSRTQNSFSAYKQIIYPEPIKRLNGLFCHALPFHAGDEQYLSVLLPILDKEEGYVVRGKMQDTLKSVFYPELMLLLPMMREAGIVYYRENCTPALIWECFNAFFFNACCMAISDSSFDEAPYDTVVPVLNSARSLLEKMLDLPYGSMVLINADELVRVLTEAKQHIIPEC